MKSLAIALVLSGAHGADANPDLRSPEITVSVGAVLPVFVVYEFPGPWASVSAAWKLHPHAQLVASADLGVMFASGARRYIGSMGAGIRVAPWRNGPWAQLGLGTMGFVERIGILLPERTVTATDVGVKLTADLALGARVGAWEFAVGWDHFIVPLHYYEHYTGDESLPYRGNFMAWFGRQL